MTQKRNLLPISNHCSSLLKWNLTPQTGILTQLKLRLGLKPRDWDSNLAKTQNKIWIHFLFYFFN